MRQTYCPVVAANQQAINQFLFRHPSLIRDIRLFRPRLMDELIQKHGPVVAKKILEEALKKTIDKAVDAGTKPFGLAGKVYKDYLGMGRAVLKEGILSDLEAKLAAAQISRFEAFVEALWKLSEAFRTEGAGRSYTYSELITSCSALKRDASYDRDLTGILKEQEEQVRRRIIPTMDLFLNEIQAVILPYYRQLFVKLKKKFEFEFPAKKTDSLKAQGTKGIKLAAWTRVTGPINDLDLNPNFSGLAGTLDSLFKYRNQWEGMFSYAPRKRDFNRRLCEDLKREFNAFRDSVSSEIGPYGQSF